MKYLFVTIIFITSLFANSNNQGRALYSEANCQKCHLIDKNFDPNSIKKSGLKSKVKSLKDLKKWVVDCDNYFSIGWFPDEQAKVVEYLNNTYYKLKDNNNSK